MGAAEKLHYTEEEYFEIDAAGEKEGKRYEYIDGEIFPVEDASIMHNEIVSNTNYSLKKELEGKKCKVLSSSQKVNIGTRSGYCYPDIAVICGKIETLTNQKDTLTNPIVLMEIISPTTMDYDLGGKFLLYRAIPTLMEYLCISSLKVGVTHYFRQNETQWMLNDYHSLDETISLKSIGITLAVKDVYEDIVWENDKLEK